MRCWPLVAEVERHSKTWKTVLVRSGGDMAGFDAFSANRPAREGSGVQNPVACMSLVSSTPLVAHMIGQINRSIRGCSACRQCSG